MKSKNSRALLLAIQTIIGSIIGVGIFGLPYAASQSGFFISSIFIILVGFVYTVTLILFSEVIMYTNGQSRIAGLAERYLGHHWKIPTSLLQYASSWGAMLGYTILGGAFLQVILNLWFNIDLVTAQLLFVSFASLILIGGLGVVAYVQASFFWILIALLIAMVYLGAPSIDVQNLNTFNVSNWALPLSVALFAFGGFAAIPEAADILHDQKVKLRKAVIISVAFCTFVYLLFSAIVLAVTGSSTSSDGLIGFANVIAPWFATVASGIGLFSVFSSFMVLGISNLDGLVFDFKFRYLNAWLLVIAVPITLFLLGARSFIDVIGFTGGLIGSLIGLIVIRMYKKAKHDVCMPKRCLGMPRYLIFIAQVTFVVGIAMQIIGY
jgi:tyrosine-specific transport protein